MKFFQNNQRALVIGIVTTMVAMAIWMYSTETVETSEGTTRTRFRWAKK